MALAVRRHPVLIERDQNTARTTSGEVGPADWVTFCKWWAEITPLSGNEAMAAREVYGTVTHRLEGAWVSGVTPKMRVTYGTRVFTIEAPLNVAERNRTLRLFCTEAV